MNRNVFDMNYEIRYPPNTRGFAELSQPGQNPIVEFYKAKIESINWREKDKWKWFIRELTINDEPLDTVLPSDWKIMKYRGFDKVSDIRNWLEGL
jgi:hypothetical protein